MYIDNVVTELDHELFQRSTTLTEAFVVVGEKRLASKYSAAPSPREPANPRGPAKGPKGAALPKTAKAPRGGRAKGSKKVDDAGGNDDTGGKSLCRYWAAGNCKLAAADCKFRHNLTKAERAKTG